MSSSNAPQTQAQGKSEFSILAERFEKEVMQLRERVVAINSRFSPVLRPEEPAPGQDCSKEPVLSSLENFLGSQLTIIKSCNELLIDYDKRCCL
jgi:hypothetical protein